MKVMKVAQLIKLMKVVSGHEVMKVMEGDEGDEGGGWWLVEIFLRISMPMVRQWATCFTKEL